MVCPWEGPWSLSHRRLSYKLESDVLHTGSNGKGLLGFKEGRAFSQPVGRGQPSELGPAATSREAGAAQRMRRAIGLGHEF